MTQTKDIVDTERRKRLARLKLAQMRESRLESDNKRDDNRDPDYLPEFRDIEEELSEEE